MTRILVVDDEPDILELLVDVLRDEGHELTVAHDGVVALQVLAQTLVDLVITDTMMPRSGGVELVRSMRDCVEFRQIPVILMSAAARPGMDGLGTVAFLPKPFDLAALLDAVEEALGPGSDHRHN
jgi:two-component system nitrogen regulation response regulator NtrX